MCMPGLPMLYSASWLKRMHVCLLPPLSFNSIYRFIRRSSADRTMLCEVLLCPALWMCVLWSTFCSVLFYRLLLPTGGGLLGNEGEFAFTSFFQVASKGAHRMFIP